MISFLALPFSRPGDFVGSLTCAEHLERSQIRIWRLASKGLVLISIQQESEKVGKASVHLGLTGCRWGNLGPGLLPERSPETQQSTPCIPACKQQAPDDHNLVLPLCSLQVHKIIELLTCGDPFQQCHLTGTRRYARLHPLSDPFLHVSLKLLLALAACKAPSSRHLVSYAEVSTAMVFCRAVLCTTDCS